MKNACLIPGTFIPIHEGHLRLFHDACDKYDEVFIVFAINPDKWKNYHIDQVFNSQTRLIPFNQKIKLLYTSGNIPLLADMLGINTIFRGIRDLEDFVFELDLSNKYRIFVPNLKFNYYLEHNNNFQLLRSSRILHVYPLLKTFCFLN